MNTDPDGKPYAHNEEQNDAAKADLPVFDSWSRRTIMDGEVVTFAERFTGTGVFPEGKEAQGCFRISASRNAVMIHDADIFSKRQLALVKAALDAAFLKHKELHASHER